MMVKNSFAATLRSIHPVRTEPRAAAPQLAPQTVVLQTLTPAPGSGKHATVMPQCWSGKVAAPPRDQSRLSAAALIFHRPHHSVVFGREAHNVLSVPLPVSSSVHLPAGYCLERILPALCTFAQCSHEIGAQTPRSGSPA